MGGVQFPGKKRYVTLEWPLVLGFVLGLILLWALYLCLYYFVHIISRHSSSSSASVQGSVLLLHYRTLEGDDTKLLL